MTHRRSPLLHLHLVTFSVLLVLLTAAARRCNATTTVSPAASYTGGSGGDATTTTRARSSPPSEERRHDEGSIATREPKKYSASALDPSRASTGGTGMDATTSTSTTARGPPVSSARGALAGPRLPQAPPMLPRQVHEVVTRSRPTKSSKTATTTTSRLGRTTSSPVMSTTQRTPPGGASKKETQEQGDPEAEQEDATLDQGTVLTPPATLPLYDSIQEPSSSPVSVLVVSKDTPTSSTHTPPPPFPPPLGSEENEGEKKDAEKKEDVDESIEEALVHEANTETLVQATEETQVHAPQVIAAPASVTTPSVLSDRERNGRSLDQLDRAYVSFAPTPPHPDSATTAASGAGGARTSAQLKGAYSYWGYPYPYPWHGKTLC